MLALTLEITPARLDGVYWVASPDPSWDLLVEQGGGTGKATAPAAERPDHHAVFHNASGKGCHQGAKPGENSLTLWAKRPPPPAGLQPASATPVLGEKVLAGRL